MKKFLSKVVKERLGFLNAYSKIQKERNDLKVELFIKKNAEF